MEVETVTLWQPQNAGWMTFDSFKTISFNRSQVWGHSILAWKSDSPLAQSRGGSARACPWFSSFSYTKPGPWKTYSLSGHRSSIACNTSCNGLFKAKWIKELLLLASLTSIFYNWECPFGPYVTEEWDETEHARPTAAGLESKETLGKKMNEGSQNPVRNSCPRNGPSAGLSMSATSPFFFLNSSKSATDLNTLFAKVMWSSWDFPQASEWTVRLRSLAIAFPSVPVSTNQVWFLGEISSYFAPTLEFDHFRFLLLRECQATSAYQLLPNLFLELASTRKDLLPFHLLPESSACNINF